jgi:predicted DNA-binding transcriptional regulator YafY
MNRTERFYKIETLLHQHGCLSFKALQAALEVSRATLNRDLAYLRDRLHMPIAHDRETGGYRFERAAKDGPVQYELPGLWFSAQEIHALVTMHHLIATLDTGGLLGPHIAPLLARMNALLGAADDAAEEVKKRIRLISVGARHFHLDHFQLVGSALLRRKRLAIDYHARSTDTASHREISPQRLVHYRHNWYLDAWCHSREALRSFSVDAIQRVELLDRPATDVAEERLDAVLGAGYGIFSGEAIQWATLRFSPKLARWVAAERWHPEQIGTLLDDGRYELKLPYSEDTELVMEVLRYGADCEVVGPEGLRERLREALRAAVEQYK